MTKRTCVLLLCMLGLANDMNAGGDKKNLADPTPRKEAILKLFVEEFVTITPGKGKFPETFMMGSAKEGKDSERPAHRVTLKYSFAIAKYEVTQELYHVVMGNNPARWKGLRNSVEMVNWQEANDFCKRVNKLLHERKLIAEDERIRLPSEAEWEYCCRAGSTAAYSFGDDAKDLTKYGWYKDNSKGYDPPVGVKLPNTWGLYDMHGYISEWCLDRWHPDYQGAPSDGSARTQSTSKDYAVRGGGYPDPADACRSAYRRSVPVDTRHDAIGFRCIKDKIQK